MKRFYLLLIFLLLITAKLINVGYAVAKENINCDNRYVTLVNPVRGRNLWIDKTVKSLKDQYDLAKEISAPVTWLLQYDALTDQELLGEIEKFDTPQELGVFLEVSEIFAKQARVIYPHAVPWFSPRAVFLSGYPLSDRRKLIDKLFAEFKSRFDYYPKSVGAWWIDSYSLNYMKEKYGITSAMIVADQKTTDNYGVWGQWWGVPYYPAKANILTPASSLDNKLDIVMIQWAQRDISLAYGEGWIYSNYSLQANDYIRQGKDIKYFGDLANTYLDCKNPVGQITVGLETGIESVGYINEYGNQLKYLSESSDVSFVTMSRFADKFSEIFPRFPEQFIVDSSWVLRTGSRINSKLGDDIKYHQDIAFKDFFTADSSDFLDRNLQLLNKKRQAYFPYFILIILMVGLFAFRIRLFGLWFIGTSFALLSFGLVLRSGYSLGWQVFYGPVVPLLVLIQSVIIMVSYLIIWLLSRTRLILWFIPLSFGLDFIIQSLRFSYFGGRYYFLFAVDSLRHIGLSFSRPFNLGLVNQDFSSVISVSLLRFDFAKIWDNTYLSLIAYPLLHILLAICLSCLYMKLPNKVRKILVAILIIFAALQLISIFQADPRLVQ